MKIWKVLALVLAMAVAAPAVSIARDGGGHATRAVASEKTKKKGRKGKAGKHGKGKKKGGKHAKGKKGKKAHRAAKEKHADASGSSHQSHAPSDSKIEEPVPSVNIPAEPAADLPPPNNGALAE